jgi:hypothetical protein
MSVFFHFHLYRRAQIDIWRWGWGGGGGITGEEGVDHRVDRVLRIFSIVRIGTPRPLTRERVSHPPPGHLPLVQWGAPSLAGVGVGGPGIPIPTMGQTLWYSIGRYICTSWG